ncbi:pleiotropic drug resistance protein 3-like [Fagus crenata]
MAQMVGASEIELAENARTLRSLLIDTRIIELANKRRLHSLLQHHNFSFHSSSTFSSDKDDVADEYAIQWAPIERLPAFERLRTSLFDKGDEKEKRVIDVTKLGALEPHSFIEKLIKNIENNNLRLLRKIRKRINKVGVKLPTLEVRYKNLCVKVECEVVHGKPLPTLWNSLKRTIFVTNSLPSLIRTSWPIFSKLILTPSMAMIETVVRSMEFAKLLGTKSRQAKISIIDDVSGIIKPGRITLLLGPPGCGKTSLLMALSGNLNQSLKCCIFWIGKISYNRYKLEEFVPQKTSAYISQNDQHIPEMTVREILDFSACCQDVMVEVSKREKEAGIVPDPDIDTYMKAISVKGLKGTLQTDYILKILGLDICADTLVGDATRRGISSSEKRRLTTGERIVGPTKALFMDEITNGVDSSTAFQIVTCIQQLVHITDATALVLLLQPAPETFDLFDDLILMSEGKIMYHGPRDHVLEFFEDCGLRCPERKGVISGKDQAQYWCHMEVPYSYVSVDMFSRKFKESRYEKKLDEKLSEPYDKSQSHKDALSFSL